MNNLADDLHHTVQLAVQPKNDRVIDPLIKHLQR